MKPRGSENRKEQTHAEYESVVVRRGDGWVALTGTAALITSGPSVEAAQEKAFKTHWRHHDGHWSYCRGRQAVVLHGRNALVLFRTECVETLSFDRGFGREGFERGRTRAGRGGQSVVRGTSLSSRLR